MHIHIHAHNTHRYIPATLAAKSEINPGVLNLKLQKVTVLEDAARSMFPLKAWPHITNQPHARSPRRKTLHPPVRARMAVCKSIS